MTDKFTQPEALRIADLLETGGWPDAAELRRLQADLNDVQDQRRAAFRMIERLNDELGRVCEQRDKLLEALKTVTKHLDVVSSNTTDLEVVWAAEKVIAKATGETK